MTMPRRLQLSRKKGFNLQAFSRAANGLDAVNVARPSRWGNPWVIGQIACSCRSAGECTHNAFRSSDAAAAVAAYRDWAKSWRNPRGLLSHLPSLRGKNLACWCVPGEPCHADVLLELANEVPQASPAAHVLIGHAHGMSCDDQYAIATAVAANVGYVLRPEPLIP
jgi:hypothetical protein